MTDNELPSAEAAQPVADDTYTDEKGTLWVQPSAYRYAMVCKLLDKYEAAKRAGATLPPQGELREALERIARQRLTDDMTLEQRSDADYEYAYNEIVRQARAALAGRTAG